MPKARSDARVQFLADVMTTAIEHFGYGFPEVVEDQREDGHEADWYVVIVDRYLEPDDEGYGRHHAIDLGTIAKGLGIIRGWKAGEDGRPDDWAPAEWVRQLWLADRTNGEDGDVDVIGALAVLECAIFGEVVYN